jgi:hypothetical protein
MARNGSGDCAAKQRFLGAVLLMRLCGHGVISWHVSGAHRARRRSAPGRKLASCVRGHRQDRFNKSACEVVCARARWFQNRNPFVLSEAVNSPICGTSPTAAEAAEMLRRPRDSVSPTPCLRSPSARERGVHDHRGSIFKPPRGIA